MLIKILTGLPPSHPQKVEEKTIKPLLPKDVSGEYVFTRKL